MRMRGTFIAGAAVVSVLVAGCSDEDEDELIDDGDYGYVGDEAAWGDTCAAMNYAMVDPVDDFDFVTDDTAAVGVPSAIELAAQSAAGIRAYFTPSSCVTSTVSGATATVNLNQCNGPLGTQNISGTFTATFAPTASGFTIDVNASNVNVAGRTGNWQVDASVAPTADGWSMTVQSNGDLNGLSGNSFDRNARATISWATGSGCVQVDGQGSVATNGTTYTSSLSGYQRCTGSCPAAGTLTLDGPNQDVTVTFDGSSTPSLNSSTGVSREIQLACGN
jgi:hypothetical protein